MILVICSKVLCFYVAHFPVIFDIPIVVFVDLPNLYSTKNIFYIFFIKRGGDSPLIQTTSCKTQTIKVVGSVSNEVVMCVGD